MVTRVGTDADEFFGNGTTPGGYVNGGWLSGSGTNFVTARGGNDLIIGTLAVDTILPGLGNDSVDGRGAGDTVSYEDVNVAVTINLAAGVASGAGTDTLLNIEHMIGSNLADDFFGDDLNNIVRGLGGNDEAFLRNGNDTFFGGAGDDLVEGGFGLDVLHGEDGNDILRGQRDNDVMIGGLGADRETGGKGSDTKFGGAGSDRFVWTEACVEGSNSYVDVIADFTRGDGIVTSPGVTATILGYENATGLTAARQGFALADDPSVLDAHLELSATVNGTTWTTTLWVLDVGNNALTTSTNFIYIA